MLRETRPDVELVSEASIWDAVRWMIREHRYLIEPSSAVAIAALLCRTEPVPGPVVVVVTGRNVSTGSVTRMLTSEPGADFD